MRSPPRQAARQERVQPHAVPRDRHVVGDTRGCAVQGRPPASPRQPRTGGSGQRENGHDGLAHQVGHDAGRVSPMRTRMVATTRARIVASATYSSLPADASGVRAPAPAGWSGSPGRSADRETSPPERPATARRQRRTGRPPAVALASAAYAIDWGTSARATVTPGDEVAAPGPGHAAPSPCGIISGPVSIEVQEIRRGAA